MTRQLKGALIAFALSLGAASPKQGQAQSPPFDCDTTSSQWWTCANQRNTDIDNCTQGAGYDYCVCTANQAADGCMISYNPECITMPSPPC